MSNDVGTNAHSQSVTEIDLNTNPLARIRNPLTGISRVDLLQNVEIFANLSGLNDPEELGLLQRGAICESSPVGVGRGHVLTQRWGPVAQNPADYDTLAELSGEERGFIGGEYQHRWSHTWSLYLTIILCSMGAATQQVSPLCSRALN